MLNVKIRRFEYPNLTDVVILGGQVPKHGSSRRIDGEPPLPADILNCNTQMGDVIEWENSLTGQTCILLLPLFTAAVCVCYKHVPEYQVSQKLLMALKG